MLNERDTLAKVTDEREVSAKKTWRRPEVIRGKLDQTESNILPGPEIIIYVS